MMDISVKLLQWSTTFQIKILLRLNCKKTLATRATRDKCSSGSGIKNENISNKELTGELHKSIIRNLYKRKVYSPFMIIFGVQIQQIGN